jgi:hypothetical protein
MICTLQYTTPSGNTRHEVSVDGQALTVPAGRIGTGSYYVAVTSAEDVERIKTARVEDLRPCSLIVSINDQTLGNEIAATYTLGYTPSDAGDDVFTFSCRFIFDVGRWKQPWTMEQVGAKVRALATERRGQRRVWKDIPRPRYPDFEIVFQVAEPNCTVGELLALWAPMVQGLLAEAERRLAESTRKHSLVALFDFPPEVRTPCEQYLLYFVEFLKDLGIEAEADITHQAGRVLFSVTPNSGLEALDNIREALDIYLHLPQAANLHDTALARNPSVGKLVAAVKYLQGQVSLAEAEVELRDATIGRLRSTVETQRRHLAETVMQDSFRGAAPEATDREDIITDLVYVKPVEIRGAVGVDLPELLRRAKRLFRRDEGD